MIKESKVDAIVIPLFKNQNSFTGYAKEIDGFLNKKISTLIKNGDFKGDKNEILLYPDQSLTSKRLILLGLGLIKDCNLETIRNASASIALYIRDKNFKSYSTSIFGEELDSNLSDFIQAQIEGTKLSLYTFNKFKSDKKSLPKPINSLNIYVKDSKKHKEISSVIKETEYIAEGISLARDIANTPGNNMTPSIIANIAQNISSENSLKCEIFDEKKMKELGMGGLLSVSQGSNEPAKLIVIRHDGGNNDPIVIIGKGVTFDSGGISIKPSPKMDEMKFDKSGAATVIGAIKSISLLKLPINVIAIVPLTENLLSGSSYKPGDVITHYGGKTSEIMNTDAEGRLILADALSYSLTYKPKAIIDFATLTGACIVALGTHASGLFSNNKKLARDLFNSGQITGEPVWELPLWQPYYDQIKSDVADIKNTGSGGGGGAITAAAFLANFVNKQTPWAHLDIAGTAWIQSNPGDKKYFSKGSTGVGVRLIIRYLQQQCKLK